MRVLVRARVSLYEGRGEFQLLVEHVEDSGEGALRRAFEALKVLLAHAGLFDAASKKPLPALGKDIDGVFHAAMLDGSVHRIRRDFDAAKMKLAIMIADGDVVDLDCFKPEMK